MSSNTDKCGPPAARGRARVRHDLRTFVNHVIGYSEMLHEQASDGGWTEGAQDLMRILKAGRTLLALVNECFSDEQIHRADFDFFHIQHELRTPVNQVVGYSEMLAEQSAEAGFGEMRADLDRIRNAALHLMTRMEAEFDSTHRAEGLTPAGETGDGGHADQKDEASDRSIAPLPPKQEHLLAKFSFSESGYLLLVDDDSTNRDLLSRRLQQLGHTVVCAANGVQALKLMRAERFDLVLLDMVMPDVSGFEVLDRIRSDDALRQVPVLMLSALDDLESVVRCIERGAEDYLAKPFDPVLLRARIGACLQKTRLQQQEKAYLQLLQDEREKSETLLLNILPRSIADRLKNDEEPIADSFDQATVMFADLVGFTSLAAHISADEIVRLLNEIFTAFDLLTEKRGLEKIKTIGDAYMVVGGIPQPRPDHAEAVADLSLAIRDEIWEFNADNRTNLQMRIGISSGPVTAGVIGRHKFAYDLWGDTVNLASRMESLAHPDTILVTESTRQLLSGTHNLTERGPVDVRGRGVMTVFLLESRTHASG